MLDRVWTETDNCIEYKSECSIMEKTLRWLEKEDSDLDRMAAYGSCLAVVTYFFARLFHSLL